MDKTFLVKVTQEDINRGIERNSGKCPVAIAASRTIGVPVNACNHPITGNRIKWTALDGTKWISWFPREGGVLWFVTEFNDGRPVKPFEFSVTPEPYKGV